MSLMAKVSAYQTLMRHKAYKDARVELEIHSIREGELTKYSKVESSC